MKLTFLENEYWYGGYTVDGPAMPLDNQSEKEINLTTNQSVNQAAPLLLSSKGRYIWSQNGFTAHFRQGEIFLSENATLETGHQTLRGAYLAAAKKYFPPTGTMPDRALFEHPIYNSWIELTFYQTQEAIEQYSQTILENGLPAGVLMIDDGWSNYYGDWQFHSGKFPHPEKMLKKLHQAGFKVMLWICPFITADTVAYRDALAKDLLVKRPDGEAYIIHWWNGHSALLDMTNPTSRDWLKNQLDKLQAMGVDGFKFDAGDSFFYPADALTYKKASPDQQSQAWSNFGEQYSFNEFRVTFAAGGRPLLQRLCDKNHSWGDNGISSLIPNSLTQGITGHAFTCPDMIGGGEYVNFGQASKNLDQDLFVRYAEIACLMPAMQFSAAPYRVLDESHYNAIKKTIQIREKFIHEILDLVEQASYTGEPVIRYMSYEFPSEPVEMITDQFMLGPQLLIAPIVTPNQTGRQVYLPKGHWEHKDTIIDSTGQYFHFEATYGEPLVFEKIDNL